jgi:hypothetical protein
LGKRPKEFIVDYKISAGAVVLYTNENYAGLPMIGQIIGDYALDDT